MKVTQEQLEKIIENATRDALKQILNERGTLLPAMKYYYKHGQNDYDNKNSQTMTLGNYSDDNSNIKQNYNQSRNYKNAFDSENDDYENYSKLSKEAPAGTSTQRDYQNRANRAKQNSENLASKRVASQTGIAGKVGRLATGAAKKAGYASRKLRDSIGI